MRLGVVWPGNDDNRLMIENFNIAMFYGRPSHILRQNEIDLARIEVAQQFQRLPWRHADDNSRKSRYDPINHFGEEAGSNRLAASDTNLARSRIGNEIDL